VGAAAAAAIGPPTEFTSVRVVGSGTETAAAAHTHLANLVAKCRHAINGAILEVDSPALTEGTGIAGVTGVTGIAAAAGVEPEPEPEAESATEAVTEAVTEVYTASVRALATRAHVDLAAGVGVGVGAGADFTATDLVGAATDVFRHHTSATAGTTTTMTTTTTTPTVATQALLTSTALLPQPLRDSSLLQLSVAHLRSLRSLRHSYAYPPAGVPIGSGSGSGSGTTTFSRRGRGVCGVWNPSPRLGMSINRDLDRDVPALFRPAAAAALNARAARSRSRAGTGAGVTGAETRTSVHYDDSLVRGQVRPCKLVRTRYAAHTTPPVHTHHQYHSAAATADVTATATATATATTTASGTAIATATTILTMEEAYFCSTSGVTGPRDHHHTTTTTTTAAATTTTTTATTSIKGEGSGGGGGIRWPHVQWPQL